MEQNGDEKKIKNKEGISCATNLLIVNAGRKEKAV